MSLTRQTQKVFCSNANANQLAVFGSMKTGTPVYSTNLATLQSTAYTQGWAEALLNDKAPYMEEMNAIQYGLSYQIAYMLQEGAFAYDANTTYSNTSIVKTFEDGKMYFYHSLIDNNTGNSLSDTTYWEKISFALQSDLNGKADIDLSNTNNTAKILMSGMAMPSDTYEDLTLGASGATYTAPANGWFVYGANYAACTFMNETTGMSSTSNYVEHLTGCHAFVPVKKNDVVTLYYTGTTDSLFRFIYAKGSESEAS